MAGTFWNHCWSTVFTPNITTMKKLHYIYMLVILFGASSCARDGAPGPQGVPGQQGPPGYDGESAYVFEYDFAFNQGNDWLEGILYPEGFTVYPEDMILVYLLWESTDQYGDVWRLMPQTLMMEFGLLQYNYDFTQDDISIFLDADFSLDKLGPLYTEGWVRIVVVPGQTINGRQLAPDFTDYSAVKEAYGLPNLPSPLANQPLTR